MREWESDPLFAAAEVVQDSVDRMESIFRLLLHEQSISPGDRTDGKLLSSIDYHRRDLATTLETAKWQLEDFEREVNVSSIADKSQMKQRVITRHMQFIGAIREQIKNVEQSINISLGNSLRNMNLNEQDRDGLALFLSGGKPRRSIADQESEDNNILRRFIDPAASSSSMEDIDEKKAGESMALNMSDTAYLNHNLELKENFLGNFDLGQSPSIQEAKYGGYDEEGIRDLEANEANNKSFLQKNTLRRNFGRINMLGSLGNLLSFHDNRANRSFTKRLKDGEEQRQPPRYSNVHPGMQTYLAPLRSIFGCSNFRFSYLQLPTQSLQMSGWSRDYREICHRSLQHIQIRYRPVLFISGLLVTLLILSMLVF